MKHLRQVFSNHAAKQLLQGDGITAIGTCPYMTSTASRDLLGLLHILQVPSHWYTETPNTKHRHSTRQARSTAGEQVDVTATRLPEVRGPFGLAFPLDCRRLQQYTPITEHTRASTPAAMAM